MKKLKWTRKLVLWRQKGDNDYYLFVLSSVIVGLLTGLGAVVLKNSVNFVHEQILPLSNQSTGKWFYFVFPFVGFMLTYLYLKITKLEVKSGVPNLLFSISRNSGYLKPHNVFSSIVGSILTVGFGGSAGLEGPNISTGGGLASLVSRFFKLPYKRRMLLLGVASAGTISAIFKAPITGIIFALEVIMIDLTTLSVIPIVLASVTASLTSFWFTGNNFLYNLDFVPAFELSEVPIYILMGIITGFFGLFFSKIYNWFVRFFSKIKYLFVRFLIAGISVGILIFIFPAIFAEGYQALNTSLDSNYSYLLENDVFSEFNDNIPLIIILFLVIAVVKIVATSITIAAGGIGGFFTPILFVGANLGLFISHLFERLGFNVFHKSSTLVAMGGLIAAMFHAPLTSVFFVGELTGGYSLLVPLLITCSVSFIVIRIFQKNNFFSQQLAEQKILMTHHADQNILNMLRMKDLVECNFITIAPDKKLGDLVEVVKETRRDLFPVIDCENRFIGVISLNRIRKIMFKTELHDKISVSELMIFPDIYADIDEHLEDVAEKFEKSQRYNLLILDKSKYVGFISRSNFFAHYRKLLKEFSEE
ncbi:MAG: chloride channel protein [Bacteroidota bacterium]|nr:chloride channel protein [Bacteroidota bacterium]